MMPLALPPLAFGFTNLAILGWLAAAAAPLIIHLWMRHTHREMPWAAIRFLQAAIEKHARRLQLQQWILLALRTVILALIVLAAAKPFWTDWGKAVSSARTHRLLILDTSFSMGYRTSDGTRFERAQRLARELIDASHPGDVYTICTLSNPPQVVMGRAVADRNRIADVIAKLEITQGTADLVATLKSVNDLLGRIETEAHEIQAHEVVFLSDLGQNTWDIFNSATGEVDNDESFSQSMTAAKDLVDQIAKRSRLAVIDVGDSDATNLAVADIQLPRAPLTTAAPTTISAQVQNFSKQPASEVVAELLVGGLPVAETTVEVTPRGSASAKFAYQFAEAGPNGVEVRLREDELPLDNRRYMAVDVEDRARVLCVAGAPGAARYVAEALNPGALETAPVQPQIVSESAFSEVQMDDFACVFFCNVAQFSASERDRISRYLELGGGVVWFLGDRVLPEQYNSVLGNVDPQRPAGGGRAAIQPNKPLLRLISHTQVGVESLPQGTAILPAVLGPIVATPSYGLDPLDYRHPIVDPFRGRERAGLLTTPVSRYFRLEVPKDGRSETALATLNGHSFIVTAPVHRGRVVLVATAASLDSIDRATGEPWTAMPAWPSFLPLVREMFNYSSAAFHRQAGGLVGEVLDGLITSSTSRDLVVHRPNGQTSALETELNSEGNQWRYASTELTGIYSITVPGADQALEKFSVNADPRESTLERVDPAKLPKELEVRTVAAENEGAVVDLASDSRLHRILLTTVLALLLAETVLAWRFGRGTA